MFRISSIRGRIFSGFLLIIFFSLLICILNYYYLEKTDSIRKTEREISNIELNTLRLIKLDNDFLDIEAINPNYFITRESKFIKKHDSLTAKLFNDLAYQQNKNFDYFSIQRGLGSIAKTLAVYNNRFEELAEYLYLRGFKDYGLEGSMREYAHQLENEKAINLSAVLSLRRHEKDFFLRNDEAYINAFNELASNELKKLRNKENDSTAMQLLSAYVSTFNELVTVQRKIGLSSNEGLRDQLNLLSGKLSSDFVKLSDTMVEESSTLIKNVFLFFVTSIFVSIILALILSYFLASKLSRPVKRLSAIMDKYSNQDGPIDTSQSETIIHKPAREIAKLSDSFFSLMNQRQIQFKEIEEKSHQMGLKNIELEKLNDELDKFIYSTAHDLRSPLSSILGLINLLELDKTNSRSTEYIDMIRKSIKRMESFIRDVVDYSKNKKLGVERTAINIDELINHVLEEHRFIPSYSKIRIFVTVDSEELIYSDYSRLKIIFNNLVSNAVRYADFDKKVPFIDIQVKTTKKDFTIKFEDNGQGIEKSHLKKIFNMFYRANEKSEGSGLGLFILKETIEKLEGQVEVNSQVNIGTRFIIKIPNKLSHSIETKHLGLVTS